ncbi:efflux RND transporter periplasmic adaptor subunit [bacterium SCSIO 12741]|nr:efflux RND transporter periplasmic adaptor subunit [bacterium SCSIO 12741]
MKRALTLLLVIALVGTFGYTIYYLYQKSQESPKMALTEKPFTDNVIRKTVATGSVVPRKEVEIKPNISGIIQELYIEAGDLVEVGTVLAKVRIIPDLERLNAAEARLERANISLENAQLDYDRNQKLYEQKVISAATLQPFELALKNSKQELEAAKDNLDIIREGATRKSSATTNTLIRATAGGMVLDVPVKEGNSVIEANNFNEGTTIAFIADMSDMIFEGKVDESEVGKLRLEMPLILKIGAIEGEQFDARLSYIAPKGKEENGAIQFDIKAQVNLQDSNFVRAGYSANADIVLDRVDSVLCINESLLKFEEDKPYVEVEIGPQEFEKRFIKTGLSDGIKVEILDGITATDQIKSRMVPADEYEELKAKEQV